MIEFNHWRIEREAGGLAWLTFDKAGESTNTLSAQAMLELSQALDEFDREPPKGLVIRSTICWASTSRGARGCSMPSRHPQLSSRR